MRVTPSLGATGEINEPPASVLANAGIDVEVEAGAAAPWVSRRATVNSLVLIAVLAIAVSFSSTGGGTASSTPAVHTANHVAAIPELREPTQPLAGAVTSARWQPHAQRAAAGYYSQFRGWSDNSTATTGGAAGQRTCAALLDFDVHRLSGLTRTFVGAPCYVAATTSVQLEECADSWLEQCWTRAVAGECTAKWARYAVIAIKVPKKDSVWLPGAVELLLSAKQVFGDDNAVARLSCDTLRDLSTRVCLALARRDVTIDLERADATRGSALRSARLHDRFGMSQRIRVLEALEFRDLIVPPSRSRKDGEMGLRVDLIVGGMFPRNASQARRLWDIAENAYWRSFNFRHRHFFMWNTQRAPSLRVAPAEVLNGAALTARMETLRAAVGNNFQTWIVLDVESVKLRDIVPHFEHVVVLRAFAARYLTSLVGDSGSAAAAAAGGVGGGAAGAGVAGRSAESRRPPDYYVWVRPDLMYVSHRLASIRRSPTRDGSIIIAAKRYIGARGKPFTVNMTPGARDKHQQIALHQHQPSGLITRHLKMSDLIFIGEASALLHIYPFLLSLLHSCVAMPFPRDAFIEYYMSLGFRDARPNAELRSAQFGAAIDRVGGEPTTAATTTTVAPAAVTAP